MTGSSFSVALWILDQVQHDSGMFMDSDWFGYGWLDWVLRVQSVTWASVVGCPCDWWWFVCLVVTLCSQCQALGQALVLSHQGRGDMVVFCFVKSCLHALLLSGVCPINLTVDRRICGRAGFSYLYSFHCFHLAPLVSRHVRIVATGSSEGHQIPTAT